MPRKKIFIYCCWQWYLGLSLLVRVSDWHVGQECTQKLRIHVEAQWKAQTKSRQTCMICSVELSRPHRRLHSDAGLVLPEKVHDRNNETKKKKNYCASTHNYLMLIANCCLLLFWYFIIVFYFSNVCEYINMYYWWCVVVQSTRMGIFLYTRCF